MHPGSAVSSALMTDIAKFEQMEGNTYTTNGVHQDYVYIWSTSLLETDQVIFQLIDI